MLSTIVSIAALAACGDASEQTADRCVPSGEVAAQLTTAGGEAVAMAALDDRFDPVCVVVADPGEVTVVVRNEGRHPHNLTVAGGPSTAVDAGQVGIVTVDVPADGLRFTCTIHPGMEGRLTVSG